MKVCQVTTKQCRSHYPMPATVSDDKVHRALLKFITDGSFPESESITEAEYPVTALPAGLEQISEARQRVEVWEISLMDNYDLAIHN